MTRPPNPCVQLHPIHPPRLPVRATLTEGYTRSHFGPPQPDRPAASVGDYCSAVLIDDGSPAFSDDILGPGQAPEADDQPPLKDRLQMVRQLSADWQKTVRPMQGLLDQSARMNIGLRMARGGDMLAGSQAILISFNKLLDPTSVVRESEYARSATGQSALETMRGFVDKLSKGGAGVTISELESYKRFGEQVVQKALESRVGPERRRIERLVEYAGVDPELIFTGRFAPGAAPQGAPQALAGPVASSPAAPRCGRTRPGRGATGTRTGTRRDGRGGAQYCGRPRPGPDATDGRRGVFAHVARRHTGDSRGDGRKPLRLYGRGQKPSGGGLGPRLFGKVGTMPQNPLAAYRTPAAAQQSMRRPRNPLAAFRAAAVPGSGADSMTAASPRPRDGRQRRPRPRPRSPSGARPNCRGVPRRDDRQRPGKRGAGCE